MEDARPVVITSLNNHTASIEPATPRTADETMWVMGEVTLIDNKLAMLIKKPKIPVIAEPQRKVLKGEIPVDKGLDSVRRAVIAGISPARMITGTRAMALYRLVYHDKWRALPFTTSKLRFITTEWIAVIIELRIPKVTPINETSVPSKKTPTKNPMVTNKQAERIRRDGRE